MLVTKSRVVRFFAGPWGGSAVLFSSAAFGCLLSNFLSDPKKWTGDKAEWWETSSLWVFLLVTIAVFLAHQFAKSIKDESTQEKVDDSLQKLENFSTTLPELIRTQPPKGFVKDLGAVFEKTMATISNSSDIRELDAQERIVHCIRTILMAIATLASLFDENDDIYNANLMVFIPHNRAKYWTDKIVFIGDATLDSLEGILVLKKSFSVDAR